MPVIVNAKQPHPFLPSLGDPAAIEAERARRQDIRPLEIAVINLMADKRTTERQLAHWLGATPLQVQLTFAATDSYVDGVRAGQTPKNTPAEHIRDFYSAWSDIKDRKFDGLVVTGVNALKDTVAEESFWPEVQQILDWSQENVFSSLFLCWGAKAALRHFHGIESRKVGPNKLFGVFDFRVESDITGLLSGLPDVFPVPVSRWKTPSREEIAKTRALEIVAQSDESGPDILAEPTPGPYGELYPRRVYILNHPEYETETLAQEYRRDSDGNAAWPLPANYFPKDDPARAPRNSWRHTANIYTNWIKLVYESVPYELTLGTAEQAILKLAG